MQDILKRVAGRVDAAEVFYTDSHSTEIGYEGWKLKRCTVVQKEGYSLRVVKNGRVGMAATTDPNGIDRMIENAVATAEFGEKVDIRFPEQSEFSRPAIYDRAIEDLTIDEITSFGKIFIDYCGRHRDSSDLAFDAERTIVEVRIANTSGLNDGYKKTILSWGGFLSRVKQNDVFMVGDGSGSTHLPDMDAELKRMTDPFHEKMELANNLVTVASGRIPVVFSPRGSIVLFVPIQAAINGRSVYTKTSPLIGKEGEKIFDEKLTIVDDGTLDRKLGSSPFDDEGMPKRPIEIVEKGVFKNFVFDLVTAARTGRKSNGCGERGIFSPPVPALSNIEIMPGSQSYEEIIGSIDEGVLIEGVLGLGQGNIISGDFSNPVGTAFKIENGKLVGRVKNASISGNVYRDMKEISAIGDKQELIYGSYLLPYIRLDTINVTS